MLDKIVVAIITRNALREEDTVGLFPIVIAQIERRWVVPVRQAVVPVIVEQAGVL